MMNRYTTIVTRHLATFEEQRSKFIALAIPFAHEDQLKAFLKGVQKEYPKATHYCYAYRLLDGHCRFSDDGEPQGTAGAPILNTIVHHDIYNILVIVVRYYGGTLLGAGGLTRAYRTSAERVLSVCTKKEMRLVPHFFVRVNLRDISLLESRLSQWHAVIVTRVIDQDACYAGYAETILVDRLIDLGLGQWEVRDEGLQWVDLSTRNLNPR